LTTGIEKIDGENNVCILVGPRIRLCNRLTVQLQGSGEWLTSYLFIISQYYY